MRSLLKISACYDRIIEGKIPACVEACGIALKYGTRRELIDEARKRIAENPENYVNMIYGEHVAGGTSFLYTGTVPFSELGLNTDLQNSSYPALTKKFLYSVPAVFGILTAQVLRITQGLFYSGNHTWTHLGSSGIAGAGLNDFLLHITGEVSVRNIMQPGERIQKRELLAVLENNGRTLGILSPISGEICSTNARQEEEPGIPLEDPYREGWLYGIRPDNWVAETSSFHIAADASIWFERELERFRDFLSQSLAKITPESSGLLLQDGGELTDHTLAQLPEEIWKNSQNDFLSRTD